MGRYATREDEIDRLLRAGTLVDLHQSFKQAVRASVEEYSLKKIEAFYQFTRKTPLDESRAAMRYIEHHLELEQSLADLPPEFRETMEGYNSEDCFSAAALRDWLEARRTELLQRGENVPRPPEKTGDPSDELPGKTGPRSRPHRTTLPRNPRRFQSTFRIAIRTVVVGTAPQLAPPRGQASLARRLSARRNDRRRLA